MRIAIIVEGKTEVAFKRHLQDFLETRLAGQMPKLDFLPRDGALPTKDKLQRIVNRLLNDNRHPADTVVVAPFDVC